MVNILSGEEYCGIALPLKTDIGVQGNFTNRELVNTRVTGKYET